MNRYPLIILIIAAGLLGAGAGYLVRHSSYTADTDAIAVSPATGTRVENNLPEFQLHDVSGKLRSSTEWQDKVLVLNFWATWCLPCRDEIPIFISLQERYRSKGLQFVGIALDDPELVREFAKEVRLNYPALFGEQDVIQLARRLGNQYGGLPYTVIFDRQGRVADTRAGPYTRESLEIILEALL
jgi:thiol-disulfide isomerase/thioredoxin